MGQDGSFPATTSSPIFNNSYFIAQLFRHIQDMGGKKDGTALRAECMHVLLEHHGGAGIQPHKRLIQNQQLRFVNQGRI